MKRELVARFTLETHRQLMDQMIALAEHFGITDELVALQTVRPTPRQPEMTLLNEKRAMATLITAINHKINGPSIDSTETAEPEEAETSDTEPEETAEPDGEPEETAVGTSVWRRPLFTPNPEESHAHDNPAPKARTKPKGRG